MSKKKTHKAAKKRLKVTGNGKVKRKKAGTNHLMGKKSSSRKRRLRKGEVEDGKRAKDWKQLMDS